mmetsp:Transcript_35266/g.33493  ORF Transcript_35266/g.33493 Transcript_35266/m.33493 type:complete len:752 (-) Transcript_35266:65-2320(-)
MSNDESLGLGLLIFFSHTAFLINSYRMRGTKAVLATARKMRVVSVLPSATEILCSIGADKLLVGRSHEDNFPSTITHLPMLTGQLIEKSWTNAAAVNAEVSCALSSGKSLYFLNGELLAELKPDLILTQDLCSVCAIDLAEVRHIASKMPSPPRVLSLDPQTLEDVLGDMTVVGEAVGMQQEAAIAKGKFEERIMTVLAASNEILSEWEGIAVIPKGKGRIKVAFIEWSDPIYVGGHWTPQLIYMAGGEHTLNTCGEGTPTSYVQIGGAGKSFPVTSEAVTESDPDLVIVCPCGLDLEMSKRETDRLMTQEWFLELRAIKNKRLLVVDGDAMFNRPGPRLVDALEWLGSVLHTGDIPSVKHAVSLQPKDFPYIDYFKTVSEMDSEVNTADIKKSEEIILANIEVAHQAAVDIGSLTYEDPETGYQVFSVLAAQKRGKCCGNKCRHCPFGHYNVKEEDRQSSAVNRITQPTLLRAVGGKRVKRGTMNDDIYSMVIQKEATEEETMETMVDVMFWSGGKDSYLSLLLLEQLHIRNNSNRKIVLLTTFEGSSPDGEIAHQGLYCKDIMNQAKLLGLDLCLVPLETGASNMSYKDIVTNALEVLKRELSSDLKVSSINFRLVFGDLHLQDIKDWRVSTFPDNECIFPAFGMDYKILQNVLFNAVNNIDSTTELRAEVDSISISAWSGSFTDETTTNLFCKGEKFDPTFIKSLPHNIDPMGESGEFHTHVLFKTKPKKVKQVIEIEKYNSDELMGL